VLISSDWVFFIDAIIVIIVIIMSFVSHFSFFCVEIIFLSFFSCLAECSQIVRSVHGTCLIKLWYYVKENFWAVFGATFLHLIQDYEDFACSFL
jgi:hypothetical protein